MALEKLKDGDMKIKHLIIIGVAIASIGSVSVAALARHGEIKQSEAYTTQQALATKQAADTNAAIKQSRYDASVNRLVSVCMDAQQRFDKFTVKERVGLVRPNCTLDVQ